MKYPMYAKKNEPKFKKKTFNTLNWVTGYIACPQGHIFDQNRYETYDERGEYLRIIQKVGRQESCGGYPFEDECCKSKKHQKIVSRDAVMDEFYAVLDENLSTEFGKELKKQRNIQVEGAFEIIKQDMKFIRFTRRGLKMQK